LGIFQLPFCLIHFIKIKKAHPKDISAKEATALGNDFCCVSLLYKETFQRPVFENRVLRRIFEPGGREVSGGWRRLHSEELHNLYASQNIIQGVQIMEDEHILKDEKCIQNLGWKT
jgi:hypothetical protein